MLKRYFLPLGLIPSTVILIIGGLWRYLLNDNILSYVFGVTIESIKK